MTKNSKKRDKPKYKGRRRFVIKITVALISPFLPDILDCLMKLFQSLK